MSRGRSAGPAVRRLGRVPATSGARRHVWYSYGVSTARRRALQPSSAVQWRTMADAHGRGAGARDFRGITDTLEESDHPLGLLRFEAGTGGEAVECPGARDRPLDKVLHTALGLSMSRR
ncbi:peptidoglycan bridge formation glycyltransferase FemA/FemB family protein [Streptomyces sp. NPDC101249]|uniref:peptidoglycan bridge formation glycyltransferase FemA/FemB family protein n=1 Tax=Streptomyces sp. NPDC101249 TaxID=3366140 RepID=UPI0037FA7CE1